MPEVINRNVGCKDTIDKGIEMGADIAGPATLFLGGVLIASGNIGGFFIAVVGGSWALRKFVQTHMNSGSSKK